MQYKFKFIKNKKNKSANKLTSFNDNITQNGNVSISMTKFKYLQMFMYLNL